MSPLPDLTNTSTFPGFSSIPIAGSEISSQTFLLSHPHTVSSSNTSVLDEATYLLATISENMTLSTSPTFICKDRINAPFALSIKLPSSLLDEKKYMGKFDAKDFKKGYTVVVKNPSRKGVKDGKQGHVEADLINVTVIPTTFDKLLLMSQYDCALKTQLHSEGLADSSQLCAACGKHAVEGKALAKCKGCQGVWYCDKACQFKGWNENGHKSECKILKIAGEIFGSESEQAAIV